MKHLQHIAWMAALVLLVGAGWARWHPATDQRAEQEADLESTVEMLRQAINGADVDRLESLSAERLEVGLFGAARLYSAAQASRVLHEFFREHAPVRVVLREHAATESAWFAALDYYRTDGRSALRLYLRLRLHGERWELREFVALDTPGS